MSSNGKPHAGVDFDGKQAGLDRMLERQTGDFDHAVRELVEALGEMRTSRKPKPVTTLDEALDAFIEGARLHHAGAYLRHKQMTINGLLRSNEGVDFIDAHSPNARDILLPLLKHPEDVVQITAASALIPSRLELAEQTIDHVHANSVTEAYGSAVMIKACRSTFGDYVMALCRPDPRYPCPKARPRKPVTEGKP